MQSNYTMALKEVLVYEGGNDDDPDDPGGRTSRGILQREYNKYRTSRRLPIRDVWRADQKEIEEIYRKDYWDAVRGDELPSGLDLVMFDGAVNSGLSQATKWLQRALKIEDDGKYGQGTFAAAKDATNISSVINDVMDQRLAMLKTLPTWWKYGKGWTRRVEGQRKLALQWAGQKPQPKQMSTETKIAVGTTGVVAGGIGTARQLGYDWAPIVVGAIVLITAIVFVMLVRRK